MKQETIMCELFNFSIATYYKRKRELNSAIVLIEKYFTKEDLEEFLTTKEILKMEYLNHYEDVLNAQFITFYRDNFDRGVNSEKFNKLFWQFIRKYKNKLISQKYNNFQHNKILLNNCY